MPDRGKHTFDLPGIVAGRLQAVRRVRKKIEHRHLLSVAGLQKKLKDRAGPGGFAGVELTGKQGLPVELLFNPGVHHQLIPNVLSRKRTARKEVTSRVSTPIRLSRAEFRDLPPDRLSR